MTDAFQDAVGGAVLLSSGYYKPLLSFGTYKVNGVSLDVACFISRKADVLPTLDAALRVGYRSFDTAVKYGNEAEIGEALATLLPAHGLRREDVFITTKVFPSREDWEATCGRSVDESLARLRTSYIDLCLVHYPTYDVFSAEADADAANPRRRRETYLALKRALDAGKLRSIGVSNFEARHLAELDGLEAPAPAVNQLEFHPHFARAEVREACARRGIVFEAFSSLGRFAPALFDDAVVIAIAAELSCTRPQLLLAFAIAQRIPVCPKTLSEDRMRENFEAYKVSLSAQQIGQLAALAKPGTDGNYIRAYGWRVL